MVRFDQSTWPDVSNSALDISAELTWVTEGHDRLEPFKGEFVNSLRCTIVSWRVGPSKHLRARQRMLYLLRRDTLMFAALTCRVNERWRSRTLSATSRPMPSHFLPSRSHSHRRPLHVSTTLLKNEIFNQALLFMVGRRNIKSSARVATRSNAGGTTARCDKVSSHTVGTAS